MIVTWSYSAVSVNNHDKLICHKTQNKYEKEHINTYFIIIITYKHMALALRIDGLRRTLLVISIWKLHADTSTFHQV